MTRIGELIERRRELQKELKELNKKIEELGDPYKILADEFREKLGLKRTPILTRQRSHSRNISVQRKIVEYLIEHRHTSKNRIPNDDLRKDLNIDTTAFANAVYGSIYLAWYGVGGRSEKALYIEDMQKAKISIELMKKLQELP